MLLAGAEPLLSQRSRWTGSEMARKETARRLRLRVVRKMARPGKASCGWRIAWSRAEVGVGHPPAHGREDDDSALASHREWCGKRFRVNTGGSSLRDSALAIR